MSYPDEIREVADKVLEASKVEKKGAFKLKRERDILTHALGNYYFCILFEYSGNQH